MMEFKRLSRSTGMIGNLDARGTNVAIIFKNLLITSLVRYLTTVLMKIIFKKYQNRRKKSEQKFYLKITPRPRPIADERPNDINQRIDSMNMKMKLTGLID